MKTSFITLSIILIVWILSGCRKEQQELTTVIVGDTNSINVFHDYDPDIVFPSSATRNNFLLDINGDSINDIEFIYDADVGNFYGYHGTYLVHLHSDFYFLLDSSGIKVCSENDLVNCNADFDNRGDNYEPFTLSYFYYSSVPYQINDSTWAFRDTSYHKGNWFNVENGYITYKLFDNNEWFIGWIHMGFNEKGKLEISEYGHKSVKGCL